MVTKLDKGNLKITTNSIWVEKCLKSWTKIRKQSVMDKAMIGKWTS
jgi:hypothetical protein